MAGWDDAFHRLWEAFHSKGAPEQLTVKRNDLNAVAWDGKLPPVVKVNRVTVVVRRDVLFEFLKRAAGATPQEAIT